jgi:hypothetical protein
MTFSGCGNKTTPKIIAVTTAATLEIDDTGIDLPEIKLQYDNGTEKNAAADNFWFNGNYVYVQDGKLKIKAAAPPMFVDKLEIVYRRDMAIKISIDIERVYIPLQSIALSTENKRNSCPVGSSTQIQVTFIPSNASDKNVNYEIVSGNDFAEINSNGELIVYKDAVVGNEVLIRATVNHIDLPEYIADDIDTANFTVILTPEVITATVNFFQSNTGHISGWVASDYMDINTELGINIETLIGLGYTNVNFYWRWNWCENDGNPDCTAQVVLRSFPQYSMTVNDAHAYYNKTMNPGADYKEEYINIDVGIPKVQRRPIIQAIYAYKKQDKKSWYAVDWSYCTITVS